MRASTRISSRVQVLQYFSINLLVRNACGENVSADPRFFTYIGALVHLQVIFLRVRFSKITFMLWTC